MTREGLRRSGAWFESTHPLFQQDPYVDRTGLQEAAHPQAWNSGADHARAWHTLGALSAPCAGSKITTIRCMPAHPITLNTAAALSGLSVRTWQRRVEQGQVQRLGRGAQTLVPLAAVQPAMTVTLSAADADLLARADAGDAAAQADLGALFALFALDALQRVSSGEDDVKRTEHSAATALYFLNQAAEQGNGDAMHWLGRLHAAQLAGRRGRTAESLALMWTARAAAHGHALAQEQLAALTRQVLTAA